MHILIGAPRTFGRDCRSSSYFSVQLRLCTALWVCNYQRVVSFLAEE